MMKIKKSLMLFILIFASVLLISGCSQAQTQITTDVVATGEVKEFEIESYTLVIDGKYYPQFDPQEIEVNKGDTVKLKIKVTSGVHDFNIDKFNVHVATPTDEVVEVEFVATESGEFIMYCNMPNHRALGHFGIVNVK